MERLAAAPALGVVALALVAFANTLANGFVLDDQPAIVQNPLVKSLAHLPTLFATDYWLGGLGPGFGALYRPLVLASFAVNYAVGGLEPLGYHLVNVLLHAGVGLALYALGRDLRLSAGGSLASAVLFVAHPIHTEAVAGIAGRAELLMTLGVIGALLGHLRAAPGTRRWLVLASGAAFAAALLSKEQAVVLPALLVLADLVLRAPVRPRWRRYAGHLVVLAGYLGLRWSVLGGTLAEDPRHVPFLNNPLAHASPPERVLTAVAVAGRYLWLMVWPRDLSADYSYDAIPLATSALAPGVALAALAWAALLALGLLGCRRPLPAVGFGIGCAVLAFLPVSNLVLPIGTIMGERLFYLPSAGLCLLAGAGWDAVAGRIAAGRHRRRAGPCALGLVGLVTLLLVARTVERNRDWRDGSTLFASAVRVVPRSAKAQANHGVSLAAAGRLDEAIVSLRRAVEIAPRDAGSLLHLGRGYAAAARWQEAEAAYRQSLERWRQTEGAERDPGMAEALNDLATLRYHQRRVDEAERLFRQSLALRERALGSRHPAVAQSLSNLSNVLHLQGRYDETEPLLVRAITIREAGLGPDHPALATVLTLYATVLRVTGRATAATVFETRAAAIEARAARGRWWRP